jgi:hypothetical protein
MLPFKVTFEGVVAGAFAGGFVSGALGTAFHGGNFAENAFSSAIGSTVVAAALYGVTQGAKALYQKWNQMAGTVEGQTQMQQEQTGSQARTYGDCRCDRVISTDAVQNAWSRWISPVADKQVAQAEWLWEHTLGILEKATPVAGMASIGALQISLGWPLLATPATAPLGGALIVFGGILELGAGVTGYRMIFDEPAPTPNLQK